MEENNQAGGSSYKMNRKCLSVGGNRSEAKRCKLKVIKTGGQISYN
jgi:hypothetical protein